MREHPVLNQAHNLHCIIFISRNCLYSNTMKKEFLTETHLARKRIFSGLESTSQLDNYVRQMLSKPHTDQCGVLVSGSKGAGKTFLIENYLQKFEHAHPVLVARHFQQHEKTAYFGFKNSISDYLGKIYNHLSKKDFDRFSTSFKDHLGGSFPLLLDHIPELSIITGKATGLPTRSMPTIENQLYPLFKRLFGFLAAYSGQPVFFFTDDLQWMDASGTNLLKYLLLKLPPGKFIWIGACQAPLSNIRSLRQLDEELSLKKRRIENIFLKGLNAAEVRQYLTITLEGHCGDALVEVCHRLSGGNPSHLQILLENLRSGNLIRLEKGVWNCNPQVVEARYAGQNSEAMLMNRMQKISHAAREVLSVIACMGSFNKRTILDWLGGESLLMQRVLKEAMDAGILAIRDSEVHFSDMHIGELIYNELDPGTRRMLHYKIATLFLAREGEGLAAADIILMTSNFNQCIDLLRAETRLQMVAELNYKAGKISQQENALEQARYFFKMSAELLKECAWDEVFDQVMAVYMERARVEYFLGEYELAEIHLDYLLGRVPDPIKRAKVFELKVTINNHLGRYRKVVSILKESLNELGLELPLEDKTTEEQVGKLKQLLEQEELGTYSNPPGEVDVEVRQAILKLLYVGGMGLHHTSDVLMRWAALQIIICSGAQTISGVKAIGCVSYGRMLIISGEIQKGYEFGLKGLEINNTLNDVSLRCRVYGVYAFYIQPWKKPFAESRSFLQQATLAGKASGDLIGLYIIKTHHLNLHLISGLPLKDLTQWDFEEFYSGRELTYYITHYQKSLLKFLTGETAVFEMPRKEPSWLAAELTIREEKFYRNYVWARYYFLFGHYELAAAAANEADNNRKLQEGSPLLPANLFTWFLSITQNWCEYADEASAKLTAKLGEILRSFELWQSEGPSNYKASWCLLSAEWARINGDHEDALTFYGKSAEASDSNIYHLALTHELWARYLLTLPEDRADACFHLAEAIRTFTQWGAVAKARQLRRQFEAVLATYHQCQSASDELDIETIQYELSGDMEVASLIKKLMVLLLRISGSSHVVVELVTDTGDRILKDELSLLSRTANPTMKDSSPHVATVPASLILVALKSQNTIVVNDLKSEKALRDIESIKERGVQSFLVLPVTIHGHLSMVIYLENIFAPNWYVPERIRWARITANQGAVIIENARIHERSVQLNEEIRKEMAEKERLASVIEAQKDAHLRELVQTQDNERKRIASDLHDSLGSMLSTVKLRFNGLQEEFEQKIPDKVLRFNDTIVMLDEAIHELRQIAHNMLPVSLGRFGLKAAIETFVGQINASRQLDTQLQILGLDRRLPEETEVAIYRICQELVQNVIKHANASSMRIQIIDHENTVNIIVEDNGKGMRKEDIPTGFGFSTIQSKVNLLRGAFEIETQPGKGSMVLVDLHV